MSENMPLEPLRTRQDALTESAASFMPGRPQRSSTSFGRQLDLTRSYVSLVFKLGGRERPAVDCYGLYRLFVGEQFGFWIDAYSGHTSAVSITRKLVRERANGAWFEVARKEGRQLIYKTEEHVGDLALMHDIIGSGEAAVAVPFHCGCVIGPGVLMEAVANKGVLTRPFRDTLTQRAQISVHSRVIGIYRPAVLQ